MRNNRDLLTKRQPKLRFRGFSEINSDKLKNISLIKGAGIDKIIKENEEHVFLINYMDVYKNKQLNKIKFMESSANNSDIKKYKVEYGDILITPSSENKTDIGLSSIVDFYPKELTLYSYHLNCIRVISTKINPFWLNFYFSSPFIKKYFYEVSQGITRYTLSKNNFESINVKYPCLDEQSKIAKFLSLLDKQIELYVSKLALTEIKKHWIISYAYNLYSKKTELILFSDYFKKYNIKANKHDIQVTIGKKGINLLSNQLHSTEKHKKILENSLIIGIGVQDFCVNINISDICCSPIYSTYSINGIHPLFVENIISKFLYKNRNLFTKKSTRREYEIIPKELEKITLPKINYDECNKISGLFEKINSEINFLNCKVDFLKKRKKWYLLNLFI